MLDEWTYEQYGWSFIEVFDWETWRVNFYGPHAGKV